MGYFFQIAALALAPSVAIYFVMKSNTDVIVVFGLLGALFTAVPICLILLLWRRYFLGRSDMILHLEIRFWSSGTVAGAYICLVMDVLLGTRVYAVGFSFAIMVFALIIWWYKVMMASPTGRSKPSSTRRSAAEQTMMTV
jgi:hypothetical protein